ncbi:restriction endonuclease subunit S [Aeromonas caviae]|uniref:restriction endonuclease subunit S n=1 Tax=Aeromonas caviae TaxID=648 RepID=UPI002B4A7443|nr:restriction endonuclease subunit S [Aeromonas caviae]
MSSEWISTTLGEVTSWMSGGTPKKDVAAYWNGDIPWISANSMYGTRYSDSDLRITREGLANGSRLAPESSVLLLVRGGALHNRIPVGIATREVAFNQDVKALLAKRDRLNPWYLLFWLMGQERFLLDSVVEFTGIGAGKLDTQRMQALPFLLPKLEEQNTIVALAKGIDDRIALLRETNTTLEAIAQALFKSWFVDFDPVHARARGEEPDGLAPEVAALFPDSFEESELGMAPKGWNVSSLASLMDIAGGTQPPASEFIDTPSEGYIRLIQIRDYETDAHLTFVPNTHKLRTTTAEDIMIARYGASVGRICWGLDGAYNVALVRVVCEPDHREFLRTYLLTDVFQARLAAVSGRSAQAGFNKGDIASFKLVVPSPQLLQIYQAHIWPLREKILHQRQQAQNLATLRDTLLPRLISGQLRLPEADAIVEEVS